MTSAWKMGCIRCRGCRKQSKGSGSLGGQTTPIWTQISSASDLSTFQGSDLSQMNKTLYRSSETTAEIAPREASAGPAAILAQLSSVNACLSCF